MRPFDGKLRPGREDRGDAGGREKMRDRKKQREIFKKLKEKGISRKDEAGVPDPTPYEAVQRIIKREKETLTGEKPS